MNKKQIVALVLVAAAALGIGYAMWANLHNAVAAVVVGAVVFLAVWPFVSRPLASAGDVVAEYRRQFPDQEVLHYQDCTAKGTALTLVLTRRGISLVANMGDRLYHDDARWKELAGYVRDGSSIRVVARDGSTFAQLELSDADAAEPLINNRIRRLNRA